MDAIETKSTLDTLEVSCGFDCCKDVIRVPIFILSLIDGRVHQEFRGQRFEAMGFEVSSSGYCYHLGNNNEPKCLPRMCED